LIPLGIVSAAGSDSATPTFLSLFAKVTTTYIPDNTSYVTSYDTSVTPNFILSESLYTGPNYSQTVTLEATLLASPSNGSSFLVEGQDVYFDLTPLYGGPPLQIGTSSLSGAASSSTMTTDSNGKISITLTSGQWTYNYFGQDLSEYSIKAVFDGDIEGTLGPSFSPNGQVIVGAA